MANSVSELHSKLLKLTNGRVDILTDSGQYKSTYEILKDISEVWDDIVKNQGTDSAAILELIGGKRNANTVAAILENFDIAEDALKESLGSAGSAMEENEKVLESVQGHINQLKASFEELSLALIDSGLIKGVVDFAKGLLEAVTAVVQFIDKVKVVKGLLIALMVTLSITTVANLFTAGIKWMVSSIKSVIQIIPSAIAAWKAYAAGTATASAAMQASIPVIGLVLAALTALAAGIAMCSGETEEAADDTQSQAEETSRKLKELAGAAGEYSDELIGLAMNYLEASDALNTLNGSIDAYISSRDALISGLKIEQSELDKLIAKYGSYEKALAQASLQELQGKEVDLRGGVTAAEDAIEVTSQVVGIKTQGLEQNQKEIDEAYAALEKAFAENQDEANELNIGVHFGKGNILDPADGESVVEGYYITVRDATDEMVEEYGHFLANKIQEYTSYKWILGQLADQGIGAGNAVYDGFYERYLDVKDGVEGYFKAVDELNENLAYQYLLEQTISDGLPETKEEFDSFRQKIIDAASASGEFSGSATEVSDAIDNVLRSQSNFASFYNSGDSYSNELSDFADTTAKLKSNYDLLATAQKEMASGEGLSPSTIKALADETDRYLDYLYEENGVIKLNTEAWKAYANEKMLGDISAIEDEISLLQSEKTTLENELATLQSKTDLTNEESERVRELNGLIAENTAAIEANQSKLNIYSSLYNNISGSLDAYSAALQNFSNISNAITSVSAALTTVADIQESVAKGFTISLEKALEFAKVYPEILDGASVAADGQIALNKDVVNAFISGKEAELKTQIDAEITRLESLKAVHTAQIEFAKAQLAIAQSVGEGEGQISQELAQYRVQAGNAAAQALIEAGIDEATAYKLACAAMSQNYDEFNAIVAKVCVDTAGNVDAAASSAATTIYNNMKNASSNLDGIIRAAHNAAKAIAGIGSGTQAGSTGSFSGSGGTSVGKIKVNTTSGSFNGVNYTYEAREIALEDFISELELDISSYTNAIAQLDGQIAALKALRSTSLEKFASSNKEKKTKKSGSKNKKDSWFEKEYALHQHLLKMDAENVDDYLDWLNDAYQRAYKEGVIDLNDYYKYQEEVYTGLQDLFKDYLSDVEHEISMRQNYDGEAKKIIQLYEGLIKNVEKEIAAARARGLTDEDDYIQELQKKWQDYTGSITDLRDELTSDAKDALAELIDYRIDMLKREVDEEKDALDKKLDNLKEFYDRQKELLQDQRDEEKYLDEQTEKRKTILDLKSELDMLGYDDSAWAQKRRLELQAELAEAQKDLDEFEKDHALDLALDALDKAYSDQESQLQAEMDALEEKLNDPEALYNKALEDIRKNSENQLYYQMLMYNRQFGDGNDETVIELWESAYGALTDYEKLFGALYKGVRLENETGVKSDGGWDSEVISGTNPNNKKPAQSTATSKPSTNESGSKAPALTKGSSIQVKRSATHFGSKSGGVRMASQVPGGTYTVYKTSDGQVLIGRNGVYTGWIKKSDIVGYRSGTNHSIGGLAQFDEEGDGSEYIFESSDGNRYRMFAEGSKVLNAKAADFLYNFATTGGNFLTKTLTDLLGLSGLGNMHRPVQSIEVYSGDIIVQGNASERTVSEIRRAQRDSLEFVLKELNKLNK